MGDYSQLAALLGTFPNLMMFRRFSTLTAKTLLYKQAELQHLEAQLADIEREDSCGDEKSKLYNCSWYNLNQSSENGSDDIQKRIVQEIQRKLSDYHSDLVRFSQVLRRLRRPQPEDHRFLREWLERDSLGGDFFLDNREAGAWDDINDLVALAPAGIGNDRLSGWISSRFVPSFHRTIGCRIKWLSTKHNGSPLWNYPDRLIALVSNLVCTVLSSTLPVAATCVLYHLNNPGDRLISFIIFNNIYTIILVMVVNARRVEIFAATSAFAAVQVVFVGGVNFCIPMGSNDSTNMADKMTT